VLAALGGRANVRKVEQAAGRLIVTVADASRIDERALMAQGARGVAVASPSSVHVLHEDVAMLEGKLAPLLS
jgi:phosphotransferase system IIB component